MKHPGVWVLGDLSDDDRKNGMGVVIEYAGRKGEPQWKKPAPSHWDYARFGKADANAPAADEVLEMTFAKGNAAADGFNLWTINKVPFSMKTNEPRIHLDRGKRYRLRMRNASDDIHPIHLHRHSFELTRIAGKSTGGVMKDVVMLGGSGNGSGLRRRPAGTKLVPLSPATAHGLRFHGVVRHRVTQSRSYTR